MRGLPGQFTRLHARLIPYFQGMDAWITSQLGVTLYTRHLQTFGQLVQELNVCIVVMVTPNSAVISTSEQTPSPTVLSET